jgi:hypothetical protein
VVTNDFRVSVTVKKGIDKVMSLLLALASKAAKVKRMVLAEEVLSGIGMSDVRQEDHPFASCSCMGSSSTFWIEPNPISILILFQPSPINSLPR